jgi:hypothetical protein|tara:strand:- start:327 stop:764 length:438 start_codon:yes stop_codon:yes gene_type:complete
MTNDDFFSFVLKEIGCRLSFPSFFYRLARTRSLLLRYDFNLGQPKALANGYRNPPLAAVDSSSTARRMMKPIEKQGRPKEWFLQRITWQREKPCWASFVFHCFHTSGQAIVPPSISFSFPFLFLSFVSVGNKKGKEICWGDGQRS